MRALRITDLLDATPLDGRGRRSPAFRLALDERDRYLVEAARFFPGLSAREVAHRLRSRLLLYREGRWRRSRTEIWCPHPAERLEAVLWRLLRVRDHVPSEVTIRRALAFHDPEDVVRFHI